MLTYVTTPDTDVISNVKTRVQTCALAVATASAARPLIAPRVLSRDTTSHVVRNVTTVWHWRTATSSERSAKAFALFMERSARLHATPYATLHAVSSARRAATIAVRAAAKAARDVIATATADVMSWRTASKSGVRPYQILELRTCLKCLCLWFSLN